MPIAAKTLHRATAILVLAFLALHMITHLSGLWGVDAYNATQSLFRKLYRNPVIEPILLLAIIIQLLTGLRLLIQKFRRGLRGPWDKTQAYSGAIVLFFTVQHLTSFVISRWIEGLNTNFYWPASVMDGAPFIYYFTPYYFTGVAALFVHFACAARLILLRRQKRPAAAIMFWTVSLAGAAIAAAIVLMLMGTFYAISLPIEWIEYLRIFIPNYGM